MNAVECKERPATADGKGASDIGKIEFKPKTLLYPTPVLLVSSGTEDGRTNVMTAGWTGTVCTTPPMAYVSIRPSRVSYQMIEESGEFVLNLTTEALAEATDGCGVTSASECPDKWAKYGLTPGKASHLSYAPIIMESPLNIECKVTDIIALGSHDLFLGEVVGIDVSEEYAGDKGLVCLDDADLIAFSSRSAGHGVPVGSYVKLGETIGRYGYTAASDVRTH